MIQIGFLILAGLLLFQGIRAITGLETGDKTTPKGVAIVIVFFGASLGLFALFIPTLLHLYMGSNERSRRVILPKSVLAEPVEAETEPGEAQTEPAEAENVVNSISVMVTSSDRVVVGDNEGTVSDLASFLRAELEDLGEVSPGQCRIFIYSDPNMPTRTVRQVIQICQEIGFERFSLHGTNE